MGKNKVSGKIGIRVRNSDPLSFKNVIPGLHEKNADPKPRKCPPRAPISRIDFAKERCTYQSELMINLVMGCLKCRSSCGKLLEKVLLDKKNYLRRVDKLKPYLKTLIILDMFGSEILRKKYIFFLFFLIKLRFYCSF